MACAGVLPVELIGFTGKQQANGILLNWQTASEQNNEGFHVERSSDARSWETIGIRRRQRQLYGKQDYSFLDEKPLIGRRLLSPAANGFRWQEELSKVVSVELKNIGTVHVFPNPVSNGELTCFCLKIWKKCIIQLFSPVGQLLRSIIPVAVLLLCRLVVYQRAFIPYKWVHSFEKIVVQN